MTQDTLLPIADDDYGVNVSWESDSDALTIDAQGNVSVVRGRTGTEGDPEGDRDPQ